MPLFLLNIDSLDTILFDAPLQTFTLLLKALAKLLAAAR